ncbi:hypothetical protein BHE74_00011260 [Ensete ventricosum]|nr:hypothetical protein BHE74_00011260 [Ensete ventricosum]RZS04039.1 hypothetical protein BHM03_00034310 [Ensete ventricosum]
MLSNRICGSRRRIPPINLRPPQTLLGRSTPTHLPSRHFCLLYRRNHRTTSYSERFIRCLPLPFLHRATSPHLQPSSTRSATLLPTSLLDLYNQHIITNCRRSSSTKRSRTEVHLSRLSPVLTQTRPAAKRLPVVAATPAPAAASQPSALEPSYFYRCQLSLPHLLLLLLPRATPRSLIAALNPQAYVGLFFCNNSCSRLLLPTVAALAPATASKPLSRRSSLSEAPFTGSPL